MLIALEGLPGAGKTTSASLVAERLGGVALRETTANHPFVTSVYRDDDRYDLEVELAFLLLHSSAWRRIDRSIITVADFSRHKDVLFADDMLSPSVDLELFMAAYERLYADLPPAEIAIYLKATPELCLERARLRWEHDPRREFEQGMTHERLQRMKRLYETRLHELGDEVLVLELEDVLANPMSDEASMNRVADAIVELLSGRLDAAHRA
jgi:deoxyadenosine/deoxycytidine kinase